MCVCICISTVVAYFCKYYVLIHLGIGLIAVRFAIFKELFPFWDTLVLNDQLYSQEWGKQIIVNRNFWDCLTSGNPNKYYLPNMEFTNPKSR